MPPRRSVHQTVDRVRSEAVDRLYAWPGIARQPDDKSMFHIEILVWHAACFFLGQEVIVRPGGE